MKDRVVFLGLLALLASVIYYCTLNIGFAGYAATVTVTGLCSRAETEAQMERCLPDSDNEQIELNESNTARMGIQYLDAFCDSA